MPDVCEHPAQPSTAPSQTATQATSTIARSNTSTAIGECGNEQTRPLRRFLLLAVVPVVLHLVVQAPAEPVYNGDSNRHVMTSVFFRDFLTDLPLSNPKEYAETYYEQYPALGLLIWPPLFHGVVGTLMLVFGTSVWVARAFVFASFVMAASCLYRICRRRMSVEQSELVSVTFSLMPMTFLYSRHVMLEMPTLALCMLCIERFDVWLSEQRTRNLYIAAVAASLAALTRFDAAMLLPTLLLMAVFAGQWKRLINRHVPIAALVAIVLLAPTYYVIWKEMGDLHLRQAAESVSGAHSQMLADGALSFYPSRIPEQAGWVVTAFLLIGIVSCFRKQHRAAVGLFSAIMLGTYVTFTPLAELRSRHAIYWLPAVAWFASVGAIAVSDMIRRVAPDKLSTGPTLGAGFLVAGVVWAAFGTNVYRVTGYERAAEVALSHTSEGDSVFVDGWWDGNFTYHLRHLDTSRSRHVVRADRVLYDFTNVPTVDFQTFVESDDEMLNAIAKAAPACIVFEDPQPFGQIPISEQMRSLIKSLPEQFPPLEVIPVSSTVPGARPFSLRVFAVDLPKLNSHLEHGDDKSHTQTSGLTKARQ